MGFPLPLSTAHLNHGTLNSRGTPIFLSFLSTDVWCRRRSPPPVDKKRARARTKTITKSSMVAVVVVVVAVVVDTAITLRRRSRISRRRKCFDGGADTLLRFPRTLFTVSFSAFARRVENANALDANRLTDRPTDRHTGRPAVEHRQWTATTTAAAAAAAAPAAAAAAAAVTTTTTWVRYE